MSKLICFMLGLIVGYIWGAWAVSGEYCQEK